MPQDKISGQIIDTIRETSTYKRLDQLILICGANDDSLETEFAKGAKATADLLNKLMGTHTAGIQNHKEDEKETNKNIHCDLRRDHKGTEWESRGIKEKEIKKKNKEYIKEVLQPGDDVQADNIYEEISDEDNLKESNADNIYEELSDEEYPEEPVYEEIREEVSDYDLYSEENLHPQFYPPEHRDPTPIPSFDKCPFHVLQKFFFIFEEHFRIF